MKKYLAILLTAALLLCAAPLAGFTAIEWPALSFNNLFPSAKAAKIVDSGTCGAEGDGSNLIWTLDDAGTLTINGKGKMRTYACFVSYPNEYTTAPWGGSVSNANRVKTIVIKNGVTSIGTTAFNGCAGLMSVTVEANNPVYFSAGNCIIEKASKTLVVGCKNSVIPTDGSVTRIGSSAFSSRAGLTSVTIPDSVTSIGERAFNGCAGLTSVTIPDSVTSIGNYAFYGCTGLTQLAVDSNNSVYFSAGNCIVEKDSKTLVVGCNNSVIPGDGSVTSIGYEAFCVCAGLTSVTIPDSVTSIGDRAFFGCAGLTSVTIPDSVTSIGDGAFYGCTGLTSIIVPVSVTQIGLEAIPESTAIFGTAGSYAQRWAEGQGRAFVPIGEATVTLNVPEVVNEPAVNTYGFANPGATVRLSVNGTETTKTTAAANCRWSAAIPLTGAKDGDSFTIKAAVTLDGKTAEKTATVSYQPDAIVMQEFTLNHRGYSVAVKEDNLGVSFPNITYVPGDPLAFKIKVTNNDRIDKLYVVSTKDGDSKRMELTYNEATGYWFAEGFFDEADKNYVPGVFTIKGTDKDGKEFDVGCSIKIQFLIDPSGYAYEAVQGNKLEGVTAAVYYKDEAGHELLWNAETADQINPVKTLADGAFAWVVPEGQWQVRLYKDGYKDAASEWMDVPPEHTNVIIPMVNENAPEVAYLNVYADRAEITFSQYMNIDSVNADSVTFEGYKGVLAPIDKTETAAGSGVFYAKSFTFTPEKAFTGEVSVTVSGVKNYADKEIASPYTATFTVAAEPKNLTATQGVFVIYGKTAKITVTAKNAAGKTVSISCDSANITLSAKSLTLDESGKATLTVIGEMPGTANLTFTLDGTKLTATTKVAVEVPGVPADPEQPDEPDHPATPTDPDQPVPATPTDPDQPTYALGDVDGDGEISSGDARLALRASVQLEKYEKGSAAFLAADADGNGEIESSDARTILRVSVKLESFR